MIVYIHPENSGDKYLITDLPNVSFTFDGGGSIRLEPPRGWTAGYGFRKASSFYKDLQKETKMKEALA